MHDLITRWTLSEMNEHVLGCHCCEAIRDGERELLVRVRG